MLDLTEEFVLENPIVDRQDLIEAGDWWWDLTWQEIRREVRETIERWDDERYALIEGIQERGNIYGSRGLSISDFIA